jgi:hypothetical protein
MRCTRRAKTRAPERGRWAEKSIACTEETLHSCRRHQICLRQFGAAAEVWALTANAENATIKLWRFLGQTKQAFHDA